MPYPKWHSARILNPGLFVKDTFRNKTIAPGVEVILGKRTPDGNMEVQTYRFAVDKYTVAEAQTWLKEQKITWFKFEPAEAEAVKAFIALQCFKTEIGTADILAMIEPATLAAIRAKDAHPFFQAYSICHEGTSCPTVIGDTARPIHWTRRAIQSIKNVLTKGIKFFFRHNADNSTENRKELGEVVADAQKEIDGRLHHVVIGYFPDKESVQAFDVCSQEADWNLIDEAGKWIADKIEKLTGIALSKSTIDKPAFDGAVRLGMVQAFEAGTDGEEIADMNITGKVKEETDIMTKDEVIKAVRELNLHPAQIFTLDDLRGDRVFGKIIDDNESLKVAVKEKDDAIAAAKAESEKTAKQMMTLTAATRMKKMIADGQIKLTEKQKAFIEKRFTGEIADTSDDGIKKYIESELNTFRVAMETAGVKEDVPPVTTPVTDTVDMTKAVNNPLLDADFDMEM